MIRESFFLNACSIFMKADFNYYLFALTSFLILSFFHSLFVSIVKRITRLCKSFWIDTTTISERYVLLTVLWWYSLALLPKKIPLSKHIHVAKKKIFQAEKILLPTIVWRNRKSFCSLFLILVTHLKSSGLITFLCWFSILFWLELLAMINGFTNTGKVLS